MAFSKLEVTHFDKIISALAHERVQFSLTSVRSTAEYMRWFNDPRVRAGLFETTPREEADISQWLEDISQSSVDYYLSILVNKRHVGHVGLNSIDRDAGVAEVGIVIGERDCWNKGIGKTAIKMIKIEAKTRFNLRRLKARILSTNQRSIHLFQRCGFVVQSTESDWLELECELV